MAKTPKVKFKAGDDLRLVMYVTDKTTANAMAEELTLNILKNELEVLLSANPIDEELVSDKRYEIIAQEAVYKAQKVVNITGWTISCQMKWLGKPVATLTISDRDDEDGKFTVSHPSATVDDVPGTQTWKPRVYDVDLQFSISGVLTSSQTFQLDVQRDVTID